MTSWAVEFSELEASVITNTRGRLPSLQEGDDVLFFERTNDDLIFFGVSAVETVKTEIVEEGREFVIAASFVDATELDPSRLLSDFTYSLKKVYRYLEPTIHFRQRVIKLLGEDFNSIVRGEIFWARSAFGNFVNCLPADRLLAFIQLVSQNVPDLLLETPIFARLWPMLRDWIRDEYVDAYFYAFGIAELATDLRDTGVDFRDLRIGIHETSMSASLWQMEKNLSEFYSSVFGAFDEGSIQKVETGSTGLWEDLDQRIAENIQVETQFQSRFSRIPWPITQQIRL